MKRLLITVLFVFPFFSSFVGNHPVVVGLLLAQPYVTETPQAMRVVTLQDKKSFKEQIRTTNTIYIVKSAFDLGASKVSFPSGCVLKFEGGVLFNGELDGRQTRIESTPVKIFDNISFSGSWSVAESYAEWFGAVGDGKHDDGPALQAALASPFLIIRLLGTNVYGVGTYVDKKNRIGLKTCHDNTTIIGTHKGTEDNRCPQIKALPSASFNVMFHVGHRVTTLSGFQIYGNYKRTSKGFTELNIKTGLEANNGDKMLGYLDLDNIEIGYVKGDAAHLSVFCSEIRGCIARYCDRGFVFDGKSSTVTSCLVSNCFVIASRHDAYYAYRTYYSNFVQCYADYCGYDHFGGSFNTNDLSPVFHLANSQGVNFEGCGSEQSAKVVSCEGSINIVFTGGHFNVCGKSRDASIDSYILFKKCNSISFIGSYLYETSNSHIRITANDSDNIAMIRCLYWYSGKLLNLTRSCIAPGSSLIQLSESLEEVCSSTDRPTKLTNKDIGFRIFDSDLNKPLWWSKKGWVDAQGNVVK